MKLLVVNYEYPPIGGGGGFVTRDIIENIVERGHGVTVITSQYNDLRKHETINGVDIIRVPVCCRKQMESANLISMLSYLPSSIIKSIVDFDSKTFDIINTHFAIPSGPSGWILSKMFCLPNVLSIHGGDIFDPSKSLSPHNTPVLSDTVRLMLKTADRVVAQSSNTKSNAARYYKVDRQIDIIPLGIKKPVFERKRRADFGLSEDDFIFCTIGRLVKRKNIDETLQMLSGLDQDLRVKLLVMGDGPQYAHISNLAKQLSLHDKVVMLGNVSDEMKFQLLSVSDCYISTAMHEGFGLVFLEAMECGLPVICYDFGGQTDFLINGKTGFLVELGNMQKLHQRVIETMNDREMRGKMGNFNRQLVCNFYIERCADQYITLFEQLIHDSVNPNVA